MKPVPAVVAPLLEACTAALPTLLGNDAIGLYTRGSLATGDFDPETSDVDLTCIVENPIDDATFDRLASWHERLVREHRPWGWHLECVYFDRASAKRFVPGVHHVTRHRGEPLARVLHETNWIFERHVTREQGGILFGPDPKTWIDPVSREERIAAARKRVAEWCAWVDAPDDPGAFGGQRRHQAYVVETICRGLVTTQTGELPSKPRAVAEAIAFLPEPWCRLVARSRDWRQDGTVDPELVAEVAEFVRFAASLG